jgi:hypothetical protein
MRFHSHVFPRPTLLQPYAFRTCFALQNRLGLGRAQGRETVMRSLKRSS